MDVFFNTSLGVRWLFRVIKAREAIYPNSSFDLALCGQHPVRTCEAGESENVASSVLFPRLRRKVHPSPMKRR